jgi:hypothetical protein
MFEFEDPRVLRWFALIISLAIEAGAFWYGGVNVDPNASFATNLVLKAQSAGAWTWLGWVSFTLTWLWLELVRLPFINARRIRAFAGKGEVLIYETGLHWLVLLRDIRTGEINDGNEKELNEDLYPPGAKRRSFTWYAVWAPIQLAVLTTLFFLGWIAWVVRSFPQTFAAWCNSTLALIHAHLTSNLAFLGTPADAFFTALPGWFTSLVDSAREETLPLFAVLFATWFLFLQAGRAFQHIFLLGWLMRLARWLVVLFLAIAFVSTQWFDWIIPVYTFLPNNGPVAMAFFPLNFASMFLVLHVALWSSWRYGVFENLHSSDATLIVVGGIFSFQKREFDLQRIVETSIHQTWWQRLLDIGNLEIVEIGGNARTDMIKHIAGPNALDRAIKSAIQHRLHQPEDE